MPVLNPAPPVYRSPLVRRLSASLGVDVSRLRGSGLGGRVTRDDVLAAARTTGPQVAFLFCEADVTAAAAHPAAVEHRVRAALEAGALRAEVQVGVTALGTGSVPSGGAVVSVARPSRQLRAVATAAGEEVFQARSIALVMLAFDAARVDHAAAERTLAGITSALET